jgi:surface protein
MTTIFENNTAFNQDIGNWNTGLVTNMASMFRNCTNFNQDIGAWDVSNVTGFAFMFLGTPFNNNGSTSINNWDTSGCTGSMGHMFRCPFNQPIGNWNVSNVKSMDNMFNGNTVFNQDIGSWDVSSVTNMTSMLNNADAFDQDIGSWNVSNVTNFTNFMLNKTNLNYSATNLDSIYNGWSSRPVQPNLSIDFGTIKYTAAGQAGKDILTGAPNLWTIVDAGI